ncbi:MAG: hypothetical protein JXA20_04580 [Spirochaetes bacterium]|nr:hypothetical protein [Spirochaetota bacterium]
MKEHEKNERKTHDDSLFGLLSLYKANNTYVKVMVSDKKKSVAVLISENPKNWQTLMADQMKEYTDLRRLDIKTDRLSLKYLSPVHLVAILGPALGIKVPVEAITITDRLKQEGYYLLETSLRYKHKVLMAVRKVLTLSPQKRYEILEKCLAGSEE